METYKDFVIDSAQKEYFNSLFIPQIRQVQAIEKKMAAYDLQMKFTLQKQKDLRAEQDKFS